ncbi:MATE family efflux transporter, partial [Acinetobacter baumannii]|nr:MATE family efflux transporter [Acinetobacter baumannii]
LQGLTQGGQPIVSFNYGAGKPERVKKGFKLMMIVCLVYAAALWLIAEFAPSVMVNIFTNDPELRKLSVW